MMVSKKKNANDKQETKARVKVGKLQLNKETLRDLTAAEHKQVKGGQNPPANDTERVTCSCGGCG
jgi:hypothetical protein